MRSLLNEIRDCRHCAAELPLGPRPVLAAHPEARIAIIGQAPGTRVHASGVPWDDPSGVQLRKWLQVEPEDFYDARKFAIVPMGFCYPGSGKSGDLPPRKECAPLWHDRLWAEMPGIQLWLLIGQYAQARYLGPKRGPNLTETVRSYADYLPRMLPLPHPSPRNRIWLKRNPWFDTEVLPLLRQRVTEALG